MIPNDGRWSLWAIASLPVSAVGCPPLCLIGPLLGAIGLVQIRRAGLRGRGLARAGIAVGTAWTIFWIAAGAWWHVNVRRPMISGPLEAMSAGLGGDVQRFQQAFTGAGATAPADEARAFLQEVSRRYGAMEAIHPDPNAPQVAPQSIDHTAPTIPYAIRFSTTMVPAEATFVIWEGPLDPACRWRQIVLRDPAAGDLSYPVAQPP